MVVTKTYSVRLTLPTVTEIQEYVARGYYRSVTDFIYQAIREKLERMRQQDLVKAVREVIRDEISRLVKEGVIDVNV